MREPRKINRFWTPAFAGVTALETFYETLSIETPEIPSCWEVETFEKCSISLKIKAHADFNHRNILNISRIKIRMQRRDWAKGGVFQRFQVKSNGIGGVFTFCLHFITLLFINIKITSRSVSLT